MNTVAHYFYTAVYRCWAGKGRRSTVATACRPTGPHEKDLFDVQDTTDDDDKKKRGAASYVVVVV